MVDEFDGDIALFNNKTHGEMDINNGQARMDQGLETAVFISLYSGIAGEFWGDNLSVDPDFHYGGEYEALASNLNATPENVLTLIEAIKNDLNWMKTQGIAINIIVTAEIISAKDVDFNIAIFRPGQVIAENVKFSNNWEGQFKNPAHVGLE